MPQATAPSLDKAAHEILKRYPLETTLRNGRPLTLRLMGPGDRDDVVSFARRLSPDDLLFLRTNITQEPVVDAWIDNIASGHTLTVLGVDGNTVAGYASLHLNEATWMRHHAEIRLLTAPAFRSVGLGRILASEAYRAGRSLGLRKLSAQMTLDQAGARATFDKLGFKPEALLPDWVISADGRTRDLLVMAYDLDGLTDSIDA